MMPLSRIRAFDRTITEGGRSAVADLLAAPWSHDPGSVRFFRTSANVVLTLTSNGERAFLRAASACERTPQTIEGELRMLDALTARGVPVVSAIPSDRGSRIETVDTPLGPFHVVLFAALPGTIRDAETLSVPDYRRWGGAVGRIHAGLAAIPSDAVARPPSWQRAFDILETHRERVPEDTKIGAARLRARLERLPRTPAWYGLLHGDLELDNLTWDDDAIRALDFDGASCGWYLLDVAKALADPLDSGLSTTDAPIAAFLDGYRDQRPLPDTSMASLPDFRLLARLIDYASLLHAVDMPEDDADVDWLRALIARLNTWMRSFEAELATA